MTDDRKVTVNEADLRWAVRFLPKGVAIRSRFQDALDALDVLPERRTDE